MAARQAFACYNGNTTFDDSCWATLNFTAYLNDPVTCWNHTVPLCEGEILDSTCCLTTEPWTTCDLRPAHGNPGRDCSEINAQMCSYDPDINVDPRITLYVAYTVKNIYGTYLPRDLLFVLTVRLAYIAGPENAGLSSITAVLATSGKALYTGSSQSPTVARGIWPAGTQSSQSIQIGQVKNELNNATGETATMLNARLELLMSDMPSFVLFAGTGMFSGSETMSLPQEVDGLDTALRTFIVSNAMSQNGWHATRIVGVTRDDLTSSDGE